MQIDLELQKVLIVASGGSNQTNSGLNDRIKHYVVFVVH